MVRWFAEEARRINGHIIPSPEPGKKTFAMKEPVGVCAIITSWNFPNAMINAAAISKITAHVEDALARGASRATATRDRPAQFADPVVLTGATQEMRLASEETFGPVAPIFRFETEEEALEIANGPPFGLAAYFYTTDMAGAFRFGEALEAGPVGLNTGAASHAEALPAPLTLAARRGCPAQRMSKQQMKQTGRIAALFLEGEQRPVAERHHTSRI